LLGGAGSIVVADRNRLEQLEVKLLANGFNLADARKWRQFVPLDAADTLARFMLDGMPDEARFLAVIEPIVAEAQRRCQRVVVFGEMVALLWTHGSYDAAIALEKFWNALAKRYDFSLFCAYPMLGFDREKHAQAFAGVCAEHSRVIHATE
jgi:hypothetical protein